MLWFVCWEHWRYQALWKISGWTGQHCVRVFLFFLVSHRFLHIFANFVFLNFINSLETRVWVIGQALKTKEMEQFFKFHHTSKNTSILTILYENKIELMHNRIIKTWTQYHEHFFFFFYKFSKIVCFGGFTEIFRSICRTRLIIII